MKMIYVVFNIEKDGKYHAFADTIRTGENLLSHVNRYHANVAHLCESRKQAEEIAVNWNNSYRENGTYMF